jgi:DUF1680 family protein
MKKRERPGALVGLSLLILAWSCSKAPEIDYPVRPVSLTAVKLTGGFWADRQRTDIAVTIAHEMKEAEETKRLANFELAAEALGGKTGEKFLTRYPFDDSDVYKIIEAAAYVLMLEPDPELEKALDGWIEKIAAAQEPDGYLYTARTINAADTPRMSGKERWTNLESSHELYNLGHLYEAAAAHFRATGKRNLLGIALKSADFIDGLFGPGEGRLKLPPGHEEIEIGLVKLFRVTGKRKYLDLAKFFIDARGDASGHELYGAYSQDHKPVVEQDEAVGHAVRAAYLYAGVTDVAALTGETRTMEAMDRIWEDIVSKKLYLTGGIGAAGGIEGFGPAYDLPNPSGYAETCATIAYALWNWRMFLYHADGKYMDLFERAALNAFLSGYGMSGDLFFYPNPLASFGQHERTPWFTCACCPPNIARFVAQMGEFVYGVEGNRIYVNLYASSVAEVATGAGKVVLEQATDYPWSGEVKIRVDPDRSGEFTLLVRIPGWALGRPFPSDLYRYADEGGEPPSVKVNGEAQALAPVKGYQTITRSWAKGDLVEISLPMPVRRVRAHPELKADAGRVAVERGPLVYAAEATDNGGTVINLVLDDAAPLAAEPRPDLLNGVTVVTGEAEAYSLVGGKPVGKKQPLTLIPYFAWAHRGPGEMAVWLAREADKARPAVPPGLSAKAEVKASEGAQRLRGINDHYDPESSDDGIGYMHWWPRRGTLDWVEYHFPAATRVSEASVYWFDDTGRGGCRVPASWRLLYLQRNTWVPVRTTGEFGLAKDAYNTVRFSPVQTTALRLEVQAQEKWSTGIHEWKVK